MQHLERRGVNLYRRLIEHDDNIGVLVSSRREWAYKGSINLPSTIDWEI
jgi:hypothetical protein